jgi:hypothetical protein
MKETSPLNVSSRTEPSPPLAARLLGRLALSLLAAVACLLAWTLNDSLADIFVPDPFTPWKDGPSSQAIRGLALANVVSHAVLLGVAIWRGTRGVAVPLAGLLAIVTGTILLGIGWLAKGVDTQDVIVRMEVATMVGNLISILVAALLLAAAWQDRSAALGPPSHP